MNHKKISKVLWNPLTELEAALERARIQATFVLPASATDQSPATSVTVKVLSAPARTKDEEVNAMVTKLMNESVAPYVSAKTSFTINGMKLSVGKATETAEVAAEAASTTKKK